MVKKQNISNEMLFNSPFSIRALFIENIYYNTGDKMLHFKKDGAVKAVLKDNMTQPEGFDYESIDEADLPLGDDVKSLEELTEEEPEDV